MEVEKYLSKMTQENASDIHFKVGKPPAIRTTEGLKVMDVPPLSDKEVLEILKSILPQKLLDKFLSEKIDVDFAYQDGEYGRFRANAYFQRGKVSIAMRALPSQVPEFKELGLPDVIERLALMPRGLVLVTGPAGSGKTTTLASIVEFINSRLPWHIITIEDPLEIIHKDKKSVIEQREVGADIPSFALALKSVLRQDPNMVLIGEMRDRETIEAAIRLAESGTLVFGTLHTLDVNETISRVVDFFPAELQDQFRLSLAATLRGVISQRLITSSITHKKVLVTEVMIVDKLFQDFIRDKKDYKISESIAQNTTQGMQTFDQCLMKLFVDKILSLEDLELVSCNFHDLKIELQKKGLVN